jgi:flagellar protein FliJ
MKKFKFKLQKILALRESEEDLARQSLVLAEQNLLNATEMLKQLLQQYEASDSQTLVLASDYLAHSNYILRLQTQMNRSKEEIARLTKVVDEKAGELMVASQHAEVLRKIKEKRFISYNKLIEDIEAKILDEVSVQRFIRSQIK